MELTEDEMEFASRVPNIGYVRSPKARKLTLDRGKWFWMTQEVAAGHPQQVMYRLSPRDERVAEGMVDKGILRIGGYHYGKPIFIVMR